MGKIVAVTNQKGGVGKTTTAVNLTAALGAFGQKVLLVDIDPQGNATSGYGINRRSATYSSYDLLSGLQAADNIILPTAFRNVSIIPSHINLAGAEIELVSLNKREYRLRNALNPFKSQFDYILLDCPPSLGLLTLNGLNSADSILIPIQCEYYALEGLSQLMSTVKHVKRMYNPKLEIEGVLITMYDARLNLTMQVMDEVRKYFPQKVYTTAIPRNIRVSEAPSYGKPIKYYDNSSRGSEAYDNLAREFLDNNKPNGGK